MNRMEIDATFGTGHALSVAVTNLTCAGEFAIKGVQQVHLPRDLFR